MSDHATTAQTVDFPPCYSIEHLEFAERFMFGLFPKLTQFIRETTAFEHAVGVSAAHALVKRGESGITRVYGHAILLN